MRDVTGLEVQECPCRHVFRGWLKKIWSTEFFQRESKLWPFGYLFGKIGALPSRSRTLDLPISSSDAPTMNYRRLVGKLGHYAVAGSVGYERSYHTGTDILELRLSCKCVLGASGDCSTRAKRTRFFFRVFPSHWNNNENSDSSFIVRDGYSSLPLRQRKPATITNGQIFLKCSQVILHQ